METPTGIQKTLPNYVVCVTGTQNDNINIRDVVTMLINIFSHSLSLALCCDNQPGSNRLCEVEILLSWNRMLVGHHSKGKNFNVWRQSTQLNEWI